MLTTFDLVPDFIPVIGQLDDLILVPLLVDVTLKMIPDHVLNKCRELILGEKFG